ncbi:MAG: CZB domain-containing protein [Gammaproteobacteria bacterium]|nr:CZB domain-containing protein [Gammaproteobacteria bacterium]
MDFAHRLGIPSGTDSKSELITTLIDREKDHIEWMNALEVSIKTGGAFVKALNPDECAFGKWYNNYETRDETLQDILQHFDEPHRQIHALGEKLISLRDNGQVDEALECLTHERATTLRRLQALFERAREQIQGGLRQVLLFVTIDGKTPRYALIIDDINDVINYMPSELQSSRSGALGLIQKIEHVIEGIYARDNLPDCLYFDINKMTDIDELMKKVS